jgi:hypothetical protein
LAATDPFGVAGAPRGGPLGVIVNADDAPVNGDFAAVGGPGTVAPFETNLGLIVSQTQQVVDQESQEELLASALLGQNTNQAHYYNPFADREERFGLAFGAADEKTGINNRMLLRAEFAKQRSAQDQADVAGRRSGANGKEMAGKQAAQQSGAKAESKKANLNTRGAFNPNIRRASDGSQADFDSLIDLVQTTIAPTTWDESGFAALQDDRTKLRANDADVTRQVLELNTLNITNSVQWGLKDFTCVTDAGEQFNVNFRNSFGDTLDAAEVRKFAENLAKSGAVMVAQRGPQETGYWRPVVVTDEKGEATLTITIPEQSTAWKINAKGITADTLAGEAELEIVAKKDLFGELKLPLAFTDGDGRKTRNRTSRLRCGRSLADAPLKRKSRSTLPAVECRR